VTALATGFLSSLTVKAKLKDNFARRMTTQFYLRRPNKIGRRFPHADVAGNSFNWRMGQ
jgi:hypothetical protein